MQSFHFLLSFYVHLNFILLSVGQKNDDARDVMIAIIAQGY